MTATDVISPGNEKDIARDLMLFIISYLTFYPDDNLPTELEPGTTNNAKSHQIRQDLHVIGHSLGAQSAILIAAHAPDLFKSLKIIDPAMIPAEKILRAFTALPKDTFCTGLKYTYAKPGCIRNGYPQK